LAAASPTEYDDEQVVAAGQKLLGLVAV